MLGYLLILLAPLDSFKLGGGFFSAYRILAIMLLPITILYIIGSHRKIVASTRNFLWILVFCCSCLVTYVISTNKGLGASFFANDVFGIYVIVLFSIIYNSDDVETLLRYYVRSQYITLGFSVFVLLYHFILHKDITTRFSLFGFTLEMSENQLQLLSRTKSFLPPLFLPYATTLHLEMSVGIAAIICLYFAEKYKQKALKLYILAAVFSALLLLSAQKGPIISFLFSMMFYIFYYQRRNGMSKTFFRGLIVLIVGGIGIALFGQEILQYTIERFTEFGGRVSNNEDRHILLVFEAVRFWLQNFKTFLIGIGYSSGAMQQGFYTEIPETFLCTYATILAERGIFGCLFIMFYVRFLGFFKKRCNMLYIILIFVLLNFLFYEMRYIHTAWVMYAIFTVFRHNQTKGGKAVLGEI